MPQSPDGLRGSPLEFNSLDHMNHSIYPSHETQQPGVTIMPPSEGDVAQCSHHVTSAQNDHIRSLAPPQREQQPQNPPHDPNTMRPVAGNEPRPDRSLRPAADVNYADPGDEIPELFDSFDEEPETRSPAPHRPDNSSMTKHVPLKADNDLKYAGTMKWMRDSAVYHELDCIVKTPGMNFESTWVCTFTDKKSWMRWQPMINALGLGIGDHVMLKPATDANGVIVAAHVYFTRKDTEANLPLSGVVETDSEDDEPTLHTKKYIFNRNSKEKKKDEKFRRAKAQEWMKKNAILKCVLMTPGLRVPAGTLWLLPLNGKRDWITWTEMVNDLYLDYGDEVTFEEAIDSSGETFAKIYIEKHSENLTTPVAQAAAPVPVGDTAQGANTSAAHAAAPGAPRAGTANARRKRNFFTINQSERRQTDERPPQQHQVETFTAPVNPPPAPVVAPAPAPDAPATNPAPTSTAAAGAGAAEAGPSTFKRRKSLSENQWFQRRKDVMNILKRHNISTFILEMFDYTLLDLSEDDVNEVYASLKMPDDRGDSEKVREVAEKWVSRFEDI